MPAVFDESFLDATADVPITHLYGSLPDDPSLRESGWLVVERPRHRSAGRVGASVRERATVEGHIGHRVILARRTR